MRAVFAYRRSLCPVSLPSCLSLWGCESGLMGISRLVTPSTRCLSTWKRNSTRSSEESEEFEGKKFEVEMEQESEKKEGLQVEETGKEIIATAKALNLSISVKKLEDILHRIRGLSVKEAIRQLQLSRKTHNAPLVIKVLENARKNAVHNFNLDENRLVIKQIFSGRGPHLKRLNIHARGRIGFKIKRQSHLYVQVAEQPYRENEIRIGRAGPLLETRVRRNVGWQQSKRNYKNKISPIE